MGCVYKVLMWEWQKHGYGREQRLQQNYSKGGNTPMQLNDSSQTALAMRYSDTHSRALYTPKCLPLSRTCILQRYLYNELSHASQRL